MTRRDRLRDACRRWLSAAQDDLDAARVILDGECACSIACFHAQQAVEKSIKAAYVNEDAEFQFSHDLDLLRNELPGHWVFKGAFEDLSGLSFWAVKGRYPGDWSLATYEEANNMVALAERLVCAIREEIDTR